MLRSRPWRRRSASRPDDAPAAESAEASPSGSSVTDADAPDHSEDSESSDTAKGSDTSAESEASEGSDGSERSERSERSDGSGSGATADDPDPADDTALPTNVPAPEDDPPEDDSPEDDSPENEEEGEPPDEGAAGTTAAAGFWHTWTPLLLIRAAHPRQALLTAIALAGVAAALARPERELALVFGTVLIGQVILGWHNDLVDQPADRAHRRTGKPISDGRLDPGTVWFALSCAFLLLIPLAASHGVVAGAAYLLSVLVGLVGNVVLRRGLFSFLPWAVAFAAYPLFLSYGGWGEGRSLWEGDWREVLRLDAPEPGVVILSALIGVGVHVFLALWGLVADHEDGWTYLPLKLGLRMGATRLLILTLLYLAGVIAGLFYVVDQVGFTYY